MKQLQVYNPNTGGWFEMGLRGVHKDRLVLSGTGTQTYISSGTMERHLLTPLLPSSKYAKWMQLGQAMLESVPEELRGRVTGEVCDEEETEHSFRHIHKVLALSPEPKPKSDREVIQDLVDAWDTPKERVMGVINPAFDAARKHLADTADRKELK